MGGVVIPIFTLMDARMHGCTDGHVWEGKIDINPFTPTVESQGSNFLSLDEILSSV